VFGVGIEVGEFRRLPLVLIVVVVNTSLMRSAGSTVSKKASWILGSGSGKVGVVVVWVSGSDRHA
jgi:hypothetical protein